MPIPPDGSAGFRAGGRGVIADAALVLLVAVVLFFPGLGAAPLFDDDETRFASVAREMMRSGDWVVPRFNGEVADKPPLLFWTMAAAFSVFGEGPTAARLGSALFSLVSVVALFRLATRLYDREIGKWSALVLATSMLFVAEARLATTDAALLASVTLVYTLAADGWWDRAGRVRLVAGGLAPLSVGRAVAIGFVAGFGILCKGPAALLLPGTTLWLFAFCLCAPATGKKETVVARLWFSLAPLRPLALAAGFLAAAGPWHLALWMRGGGEWFSLFYGLHYLGRLAWFEPVTGMAMSPPAGHGGFPLFQVISLFGGLFPWSVFLPLAVWRALVEASRGRSETSAAEIYLCLWLLVWMVAVGFSSTQLPHYSFPAYPAACVMIAMLVAGAVRCPANLRNGWLYAAAGGLLAGSLILALAVLLLSRWLDRPMLAPFVWLAAIPAVTAAIFALAVRQGWRKAAVGFFVVGAIMFQWSFFHQSLPALGLSGGAQHAVARAAETFEGTPRWASYRYTSPGLVWASGSRVQVCQSAAEVAAFLRSGDGAFAVVGEDALGEVASVLGSAPHELLRWRPPERRSAAVLLGPSQ